MNIVDCHTHDPERSGAIINWTPGMPIEAGRLYSVGVHPWNAGNECEIDCLPDSSQIVAIGEVGLDKLRGPSLDVQLGELKKWIEISEREGLPLILHVVKAFPEIIALKKAVSPRQPWIIHGFRGKPELAAELIRHGFYLSFGNKYNPASLAVVPSERFLVESDEDCAVPDIPSFDPETAARLFKVRK